MPEVKITHYQHNSFDEYEKEVTRYLDQLVTSYSEQLNDDFPDPDERRIAEISLAVSSQLLKLHLQHRARYGHLPTN